MKRIYCKLVSFIMILSILFSCTVVSYAESLDVIDSSIGKKAIIIVPGICGSELFSSKKQRINGVDYEKGHRFWPPECITPFFDNKGVIKPQDFDNLQLESISNDLKLICCLDNGMSKIEMMPSNPVLDCRKNNEKRNFGIVNCYEKLVKSIIKNTDENEYDIIFFSYDWRQRNEDTATELENLINEKNYKNISLVGHSMGSLVCTSYLSKEENKVKVDKTIFLGAPLLGSPKAFSVLDEGRFIDGILGSIFAPLVNPIIKDITRNCRSVYELLPPKQYFDLLKKGYLKKCDGKGNIELLDTYEDTVDFIAHKIGGVNTKEFLVAAQKFYDTLFKDGNFLLSDKDLKVYSILGINQVTPEGVVVYEKGPNKEIKCNGDGMVTVQSALVANSLIEKKNYYLRNISHMGLMSNPTSVKLVCDILNDKDNIKKVNRVIVTDKRPEDKILDLCA